MLHGLKLALSARTDKHLLATDQRLREADEKVAELQRWFPQVQALIEENDKAWSTLSYNLRSLSRTAQEIYPEQHTMQYTLDHLHEAGERLAKPAAETLATEWGSVMGELRAFNERIRQLRTLQMDCVSALREKEYYHTKVETIRVNENRKKKVTERDVEKRLRNEQKLAEVESDLRFKWEQLQKELGEVERAKEMILETTLRAFVRMQDDYFARNPMSSVLALVGGGSSPTGVTETTFGEDATAPPAEQDDDIPQPPRAPSPSVSSIGGQKPLLDANGNITGPLYPQI